MSSYIVKVDDLPQWEAIKTNIVSILQKEGGEIRTELRMSDALVVETSEHGFEEIKRLEGVSKLSHANELRRVIPCDGGPGIGPR
jgi:hypothetical protein